MCIDGLGLETVGQDTSGCHSSKLNLLHFQVGDGMTMSDMLAFQTPPTTGNASFPIR